MGPRTLMVDVEGVEHWIETTPEVAALLAEAEPRLKERLFRKPECIGKVAAKAGGNPWEGPRLRFPWLIGESRTWGAEVQLWLLGLVEDCPMCNGADLPMYAYCLCCDASGADRRIPRGCVEEVKGVSADGEGLRGGLEGKR